ncbi:DUF4123 domain-containing protein [Marinobacter sp. NFXS9]|uniref:DUF4123 domain-containing protein n=1 Tax=Marinobacter sp. NFXS9 TaxID=2818433 RepID=UPI0032E001D6
MPRIAPVLPETTESVGFEAAARRFGVDRGQRCLLLVDAAQFEENVILQRLYDLDDTPDWCWLFESSELATHAEAGPLVVNTRTNSRLVQHAIAEWANSGLLLLVADQPRDTLLKGLRTALTANLQTFGPTVLRAYDTRFLQVMKACQPERLSAMVGPDTTWLWSVDLLESVEWTGHRSLDSVPSTSGFHDRAFERMLGWVSGWTACARTMPAGRSASAEDLAAFVAAQYRSGKDMPEEETPLETLWQQYERVSA